MLCHCNTWCRSHSAIRQCKKAQGKISLCSWGGYTLCDAAVRCVWIYSSEYYSLSNAPLRTWWQGSSAKHRLITLHPTSIRQWWQQHAPDKESWLLWTCRLKGILKILMAKMSTFTSSLDKHKAQQSTEEQFSDVHWWAASNSLWHFWIVIFYFLTCHIFCLFWLHS